MLDLARCPFLLLPALLGSVACASSGVRYSGVVVEPVRSPQELETRAYSSPNEALLGQVQASCAAPQASLDQPDTLGNVLCAPDELEVSMRQRAAKVGATALTEISCSSESGGRWTCVGLVMRNEDAAPTPAAQAGISGATRFDIQVERGGQGYRVERPSAPALQAVALVPRVPVSDLPIGEVRARCAEGCTETEVREAVVATASYLGADHVVFPDCQGDASGWMCRGVAGANRTRLSDE
jgi:hypothetical protein